MLIVIVDFAVSPTNTARVHAALLGEAPAARALPGNLAFGFWSDPNHPGTWRLMHQWADQASFDAYRATPAFKAAGEVLFPLMIGKPTSRAFRADMLT